MSNLKSISEMVLHEKSAQRRRKHCALAVVRRSQNLRPAANPLHGGTGRPKFNQLDLHTQFGEDRCTQFRVIVLTDPPTHKPTDRSDYNTLHRS